MPTTVFIRTYALGAYLIVELLGHGGRLSINFCQVQPKVSSKFGSHPRQQNTKERIEI